MWDDTAARRTRTGCLPSSDDSLDPFYNDPVPDVDYSNAVHDCYVLRDIGLHGVEAWQALGAKQAAPAAWEQAMAAALEARRADFTEGARRIEEACGRVDALLLEAHRGNRPLWTVRVKVCE